MNNVLGIKRFVNRFWGYLSFFLYFVGNRKYVYFNIVRLVLRFIFIELVEVIYLFFIIYWELKKRS